MKSVLKIILILMIIKNTSKLLSVIAKALNHICIALWKILKKNAWNTVPSSQQMPSKLFLPSFLDISQPFCVASSISCVGTQLKTSASKPLSPPSAWMSQTVSYSKNKRSCCVTIFTQGSREVVVNKSCNGRCLVWKTQGIL